MSGIATRIGANTSEFSKAMNDMRKDLKLSQSEFNVTATRSKLFGSELDKLKDKHKMLEDTITKQNKILDLYKNRNIQIGDELNSLGKAQTTIKQKIEETTNKYKESVKETGKSSEASEKLAKKLNSLQNEYKKNENLIEKHKKSLDKNKISMDKLETSILKNKKALENTDKEIKESESKWNKFSNTIENVDKKMSNSFGNIKDKATKLGGIITGAVTATGGAGILFAGNFEKSMSKMQSTLGASSDDMKEFKDVAMDVFGDNFGESWDDVSNSIGVVNKYLGQTGDELKNTTEFALGFRDSFGVDIEESVRSCKALMDNFGLSSEQAFNLMVQGEQNGLDFSGELVDTINEYSVQFAKVGFSAEDMFNILNSGAKSGAFNLDKVG